MGNHLANRDSNGQHGNYRVGFFGVGARFGRDDGGDHGDRQHANITASLFSPGYSIAAVIANEFAEASGDLYISSLIFLGLVLFGLTIVINAAARILIVATTRRGS